MQLTAGVLSCLVAVGLCLLWAVTIDRVAYFAADAFEGDISGGVWQGRALCRYFRGGQSTTLDAGIYDPEGDSPELYEGWPMYRFSMDAQGFSVISRCWLLVALASLAAYLCFRPPRRFTVRGLLVATTIAAVMCGLIVSGY